MHYLSVIGERVREFEDGNPLLRWLNDKFDGIERQFVPEEWQAAVFGDPAGDIRTAGWPLLRPAIPLVIIFLYVMMIVFLPTLMRKVFGPEKKFELRGASATVNAINVAMSVWLTVGVAKNAYENFGWNNGFRFYCNDVDRYAQRSDGQWTASGAWMNEWPLESLLARFDAHPVTCVSWDCIIWQDWPWLS